MINGSFSDTTYYVQGGIPLSIPEKEAPFEKLDYGMVVFSIDAKNSINETIQDRWGAIPGALTPIQLPTPQYMQSLIKKAKDPKENISFIAVGYGTGEKHPIPGEEQGPATPSDANRDTFPIRYFAQPLTFNAWNPVNDVLRLSINPAKNEQGTCNGDSGGPIFYQDPNRGLVEISLVSGGDFPCRATNTGPAFVRAEAYVFLDCATVAGGPDAVVNCVKQKFPQ